MSHDHCTYTSDCRHRKVFVHSLGPPEVAARNPCRQAPALPLCELRSALMYSTICMRHTYCSVHSSESCIGSIKRIAPAATISMRVHICASFSAVHLTKHCCPALAVNTADNCCICCPCPGCYNTSCISSKTAVVKLSVMQMI